MNRLVVLTVASGRYFPRIIRFILAPLLLLSLSACSVYPNKFKCRDARGLPCTMLREVDRQIDSGQIAEIDWEKNRRGKTCSGASFGAGSVLKERDKAELHVGGVDEGEMEEISPSGDKLYF
jgi:hypothetical protein